MAQVNLIVNSIVDSRDNFESLIAPQAGLLMIDSEGQQVVEDKIVSGIKIGDGSHSWKQLEYLPLDPNTADVWRKLCSTATTNAQLVTLPTINFAYLQISAESLSESQYESILKQVMAKDVGLDFSSEATMVWSVSQNKYVEQNALKVVSNKDYFYLRGDNTLNNKTIDRIIFNGPDSANESFTLILQDSTATTAIETLEKKVAEDIAAQIEEIENQIADVSEDVQDMRKVENIFGYDTSVSGADYGMVAFPTGAAKDQVDYFLAADGQWRQIAMDTTSITYQNKNLDTVLTELINCPAASAVKVYSGSQYGTTYVASLRSMPSSQGITTDSLIANRGVRIDNANNVLFGAAWNDIAEFREATKKFAAGFCVSENNGILDFSHKDRDKMCYIVSDTYGFCFGPEGEYNVPVAITGRVLAYAANRDKLKVGDAVCSNGHGEIRKMRWWEKIFFPQCIVGYVSEVPLYSYWGEYHTVVNNRVWVRVR